MTDFFTCVLHHFRISGVSHTSEIQLSFSFFAPFILPELSHSSFSFSGIRQLSE
jgi:hypothetical protein